MAQPLTDRFIWRSGDRQTVDRLTALNTEFSNVRTGVDRSVMLLADFESPEVRYAFFAQLRHWLYLQRRIGIIIPASLAVKHSQSFLGAIASAFKSSGRREGYSIAYRVFDTVTGAQSITDVEWGVNDCLYRSSIQGPVDNFPVNLYRTIPSVRVIQFTPPISRDTFFGNRHYFNHVIKHLSHEVIGAPRYLQDVHELRCSPDVLFYDYQGTQPSLLSAFAVWSGYIKVERLVLTGGFPQHQVQGNTQLMAAVRTAFPYLQKLDFY
ncbi:hypothetical protein CVT24_007657 [Panaeolus cyanescens]|uniref:Uncharacterized protein n=1 Tax=Panaeolus cyanescens TaxID=181874 RepID=A0A409W9Q2_9AGAR|nr:hypothetical protein CVT24_007657 [Panaeolus cyanescens]